jgi:hypothetical protein
MARFNRLIPILAACLTLSVPRAARCDDPADAKTAEAHRLLRRMLSARKEVVSGAVSISGTRKISDTKGKQAAGEISGTYLFDGGGTKFRYESQQPCNAVIAAPGTRPLPRRGAPINFIPRTYKCCKTAAYFALWSGLTDGNRHAYGNLALHPLKAETTLSAACGERPFDVMAAGVIDYIAFQKGIRTDELHERLLKLDVVEIKSVGTRTTVRLKGRASYTIEIDRENLTPVSLAWTPHDAPCKFTNKVQWKKIDGVVVPTKLTIRFLFPDVDEETCDYNFKWSRINKVFKPEEFEYTAFTKIPRGIQVYDLRGEKPLLIGTWESDGKVVPPK